MNLQNSQSGLQSSQNNSSGPDNEGIGHGPGFFNSMFLYILFFFVREY